jgi:thioesterase domain-containing protein
MTKITKVARINFPLDDELHERAKIAAFLTKTSLRQLIKEALAEKVAQIEAERGVDLAAMAEARQSGDPQDETGEQ